VLIGSEAALIRLLFVHPSARNSPFYLSLRALPVIGPKGPGHCLPLILSLTQSATTYGTSFFFDTQFPSVVFCSYPKQASYRLDHYSGNIDLPRFYCTNPWMHIIIDPNGVAFQCFNAEGIDLKKNRFRTAWNDPRLRTFRLEVREKKTFPRCEGCCFLQPL